MLYYKRRLPHWFPDNVPVFVTWRLAGSMPATPPDILRTESDPGKRFLIEDRELDQTPEGPHWLNDPRIAQMIVEALEYGEATRKFYTLHAYVIMSNHVHAVWQPLVAMPRIMHWLKAATARRANSILGRRGQSFWQIESYDHWIRSTAELTKIIRYVEWNPVNAGLVKLVEHWPWSSGRRQQDCLRYVPPYGTRTDGRSGIGSMGTPGMWGVTG